VALADEILGAAVRGPQGDLAWLGLVYQPVLGASRVDVLPADVLTGTAGLAILFADLYAATRQQRFADAARAALAPTAQSSIARLLAELDGPMPPLCGGLLGIGSRLYALRRAAVALDDPVLDAEADALLAALPLDRIVKRAPMDLAAGAPGLLLAILTPGLGGISSATVRRAGELARLIDAARKPDGSLPPPPYPPDLTFLDGLPPAPEALALGRDRLLAAAPDLAGDLDWPDAPTSGWLLDAATAYLDAPLAGLPSTAVLDRLELALEALRLTGEQRFGHVATDAAETLIDGRRRHGTWFADSFADDRHAVALYRGTAAIAHAFLRLHDLELAPSARLLAHRPKASRPHATR
jgi:hypothetical protein